LNRNEETSEIEREIDIMSVLNHPHVLNLLSSSKGKGTLTQDGKKVVQSVTYFVMPLAGKGDLGSLLKPDTYFKENLASFLFAQMVSGIEHIHSKGFVHLDLKPENMLLTKHCEIKIADFGLSFEKAGEDGQGNFTRRRVGSPPYWSPELLLDYEYSGVKADLYALGIVLFIMVFGCRPFTEAKLSDTLFHLLLQNPLQFWLSHPVAKRRIDEKTVSQETIDLLTRMLIVDPANRLSLQEIKEHPFMKASNFDCERLQAVKNMNQR